MASIAETSHFSGAACIECMDRLSRLPAYTEWLVSKSFQHGDHHRRDLEDRHSSHKESSEMKYQKYCYLSSRVNEIIRYGPALFEIFKS
jgi:hypothetical protein